jgi:PAS domain S-box-containing protein
MEKRTLKLLGKITLILLAAFLGPGNVELTARQASMPPAREKIKFKRFKVEHGLSQSTIYSIFQDSKGFLWIGTEGGLNRYDGYNFKIYEHDSETPGSLSYNMVKVIYEDSRGVLWVGTAKGVNRFNRVRETFTLIGGDESVPDNLARKVIRTIFEDSGGTVWISAEDDGLKRYDREQDRFIPCPLEPSAANANVFTVYEDKSGRLWAGAGAGLYRFDKKAQGFKLCGNSGGGPDDTSGYSVRAMVEGENGSLWLGTIGDGLLEYEPGKGVVARYRFSSGKDGDSSTDTIRSILNGKPGSGFLWLGTYGGMYRFNLKSKTWTGYTKSQAIPYSISNNVVYSLYRDRSGVLWAGTESGLNKVNNRWNLFTHWTVEPGNKDSLNDENVWTICKDRRGIIWVGTNEGLDKIDRRTGKVTHFTPKNSGLSKPRVVAICEDPSGFLWIGTMDGGLNRFDPVKETFHHYLPVPDDPQSISDDTVATLIIDSGGFLWVGTKEGGLNRFDRVKETFTHFMPGNYITCLYEDPGEPPGTLWVGTKDGLNRLNSKTGEITSYHHDPDNKKSLGDGEIYAVHRDSNNTLWVGTTDGGLNKLISDKGKGKFKRYRQVKKGTVDKEEEGQPEDPGRQRKKEAVDNEEKEKKGPPDDLIYGILEDGEGNLWISTNKGITRFDLTKETFKNFDSRDGLQSDEFHGRACFKAENDEEMFFGGINGFNAFYPSKIKDNPHPPTVVITNFLVYNEPHLATSAVEMKEIEVDYADSAISFEFAALDFTTPEKNKYKYKMVPEDTGWLFTDASRRFANYNKLSPGHYKFIVQGSNNDGAWGPETSIPITVKPTFFQTWWFKIAAFLVVVLAVFSIYRMRTGWLREKLEEQQRVQKILKQSHDEMEAARNLAELRHAENEILLTAISTLFIAVDSEGVVFQWNQPAVSFFHIPEQKALKRKLVDVLKDSVSQKELDDIIDKGLTRHTSSREIEIQVNLSSRGKGVKLLLAGVSPIIDQAGKKLGFLVMAEDITNRKEEEMMQNLSKKLEALGQMASGIAHEIKTPLQYIGHNARFVGDSFNDVVKVFGLISELLPYIEASGNKDIAAKITQLMKEYDLDYVLDEVPRASEQIINGVGKVSEIIQSMTDYSYPGRGFKEKCDINELIKSTLVVVQNSIKKQADIDLELYERLPQIPCYPGELSQVFLNMLVNSVDAIEESGKWGYIKISTGLDLKDVVIVISDSGSGIPDSYKDNIFNPFFTTKEVGKGTGQGLSMAHNVIIEKHSGKLDFTSKVGEGTNFYIRLPLEMEGER